MSQLDDQSERAAERLSFFVLKEAYTAVSELVRIMDPVVARRFFEAVEQNAEATLQRMFVEQSEGLDTALIVTAVAEKLVPIFDGAHVSSKEPQPAMSAPAAAAA